MVVVHQAKQLEANLYLKNLILNFFLLVNFIDIYLTKGERKKGVASKALNLAINKVNFYSFRAIIKKSNRRSYNFFLKNGFSLSHEDNNMWVLVNIIK